MSSKPFISQSIIASKPQSGGSLYLKAGSGTGSYINSEFDGDIIFQLADGTEFLKLQGDGKVFVRGGTC